MLISADGGEFKMLRSKCVNAKEVEAERLVPIRFERQRVNRGE